MTDDLRSSSARPAYVDRLALSDVPFTDKVTEERFYQGPAIVQRLNLVLHLLRATRRVSLIVAADGVGKTTMLDELARRAGTDLRLCRLDGNTVTEPGQLFAACLRAFSMDAVPAGEKSADSLQNQLKTLQKHQIVPVLVIDNLQQLNAASQDKLAEMLAWQEDEQYLLQAVLSTTTANTRLSSQTTRLHTVHLPTLESDEVAAYLMARLQGVGYQAEIPFKNRDLRRFYRRSGGVPARINQLAHQRLLGVAQVMPAWLRFHRLGRYFKWLAYGLLAIAIALALFYQDRINALFTPPAQIETTEQVMPDPADELATVNVEDDEVTSKGEADRQELTTLVNELEADLQQRTADTPPPLMLEQQWLDAMQNTVNSRQNALTPPPSLTLDGALDLSARPRQQQPAAAESPPGPLATLTAEPGIRSVQWILSQPPTAYTFQLMGSWDVQDVKDFIDTYELAGDVAVFSSLRDGKNWHAVLYGQYPSRAEALEARDNWQAPRNNLSNWLRRFDGVQTQIRERPPQP